MKTTSPGLHPLIVIFLLIFMGGAFQIWNIVKDQYRLNNFPPRGDQVLALGDDLTFSTTTGYVSLLESRFDIKIAHAGAIGETSKSALLHLKNSVLDKHPDIVIIFLGTEDMRVGIPEPATLINIRAIIGQIEATGATVILVAPRGDIQEDLGGDNWRALSRELGTLYVPPVLDNIQNDPQYKIDETHFNENGNLKIADQIAPELINAVLSAPSSNINRE